jgi:subtilisin family serine protease
MRKLLLLIALAIPAAAQVVPGRYFVTLDGDTAASAMAARGLRANSQTELAAERSRVRKGQASVRTEVQHRGGRVIGSVDVVANALIVEMTAAQALEMRSVAGVRAVKPVHRMQKALDQALPIHNIPAVWATLPNGSASAGAGIKVGVLDSGIDATHPAFQGTGLTMPAGFPKTDNAGDQAYITPKIIVAKNYSDDPDANDNDGHGTSDAMCVGGASTPANNGPITGTISGAAPAVFLGNYKIYGADGGTDAMFVQAINDAVADGMDIVTTSIGNAVSLPPNADLPAQAVEQAVAMGVVFVASAGNQGPEPNSMSSPAIAASAIAVGSSQSTRSYPFYSSLIFPPNTNGYQGVPGDGSITASGITAATVDIAASLDPTGLGCSAFPGGSLTGKIALIQRGTCTFATKIGNAASAGAVAVILYMSTSALDAFDIVADPYNPAFAQGSTTLPATMIGYSDGNDLKTRIAASPGLSVHVEFAPPSFVPSSKNQMSTFSSGGPNLDLAIKPEIVATGDSLIVATELNDPTGYGYDPTGITVASGTSLSAPIVAGALAVLKGARPGLTAQQYRSLIVNSSSLFNIDGGGTAPVMQAGAGILNLMTSMNSTVTASPITISFNKAGSSTQTLSLTNIGTAADTLTLSILSTDGIAPATLSTNTLSVAPGATGTVTVQIPSNLQAGAYSGYVKVQSSASGAELHVPYWFGVASGTPAYIALLYNDGYDYAGTSVQYAITFRVLDAAGMPVTGVTPTVSVVTGAGKVSSLYGDDPSLGGTWDVDVVLDVTPGYNVYKITAGGVTKFVEIQGQ